MSKKFLSLVLALVMVLGTFVPVSFAANNEEKVTKLTGADKKIEYLKSKKFIEGDEKGNLNLSKTITRAEMTKIIVFANGQKNLAEKLQGTANPFKDVNKTDWFDGVVTVSSTQPAKSNGLFLVNGYPDGTFKPANDITVAEVAKILVVLVDKNLKADDIVKNNKNWPTSWMAAAKELGLFADTDNLNANDKIVRKDAFVMLFNALEKLGFIRNYNVKEVIGILSSLKNNEITLNQDSKTTYKFDGNTVTIRTSKARNIEQITDNTEGFWRGALVRLLIDENDVVTHILQLGNPKDMAIGLPRGSFGKNARWKGVANNTVSTLLEKRTETLANNNEAKGKSYVTFKYNSNGNADQVVFHGVNKAYSHGNHDKKLTLDLRDDTQVFVANPYNNKMRKVNSIEDALLLIGFGKSYDRIPNVYAGFNAPYGERSNIFHIGEKSGLHAKVIVFNVVTKADKSPIYRVVDADKEEVETSDLKTLTFDASGLPVFNGVGKKYDVIQVINGQLETLLKHSNTAKYPIVKVVGVKNGRSLIEVKDRIGQISTLDLRDATIFGEISKGDIIQIAFADAKKATIDIVSKLPAKTDLEGYLDNTINYTKNTAFVKIADINGQNTDGWTRVNSGEFKGYDQAYLLIYREDTSSFVAKENILFTQNEFDALTEYVNIVKKYNLIKEAKLRVVLVEFYKKDGRLVTTNIKTLAGDTITEADDIAREYDVTRKLIAGSELSEKQKNEFKGKALDIFNDLHDRYKVRNLKALEKNIKEEIKKNELDKAKKEALAKIEKATDKALAYITSKEERKLIADKIEEGKKMISKVDAKKLVEAAKTIEELKALNVSETK